MKIADTEIDYPLSERTIIRHNYHYKGFDFINDLGFPCEYRVMKDGQYLGVVVRYYGGRLLTECGSVAQTGRRLY